MTYFFPFYIRFLAFGPSLVIALTDGLGSGDVLETICQYFYYNLKNQGSKNIIDMDLPKEQLMQLILAAEYLESMLPMERSAVSQDADPGPTA